MAQSTFLQFDVTCVCGERFRTNGSGRCPKCNLGYGIHWPPLCGCAECALLAPDYLRYHLYVKPRSMQEA